MRSFILLILFSLLSSVHADSGLRVDNARIGEAPPTVSVHAGYLDIRNNQPEPVDLIAVSSSLYDHVEIHLTQVEAGVARMRQQKKITIPAASSFSLAPGEYHLMLFHNKQAIRTGDQVPLELLFSNGEKLELTADVVRVSGEHGHHH